MSRRTMQGVSHVLCHCLTSAAATMCSLCDLRGKTHRGEQMPISGPTVHHSTHVKVYRYKQNIMANDLETTQIEGSGRLPVELPDDDCHGSHQDAGLYIGRVGQKHTRCDRHTVSVCS